jgi:GTP pyrophosphokinase
MVRWLMGTLLAGTPAPDERAGDPALLAELGRSAMLTLDSLALEGVVTGRVKTLESTLAKMHRKGIAFDDVADRVAVRVTVPTTDDCYRVLDALHQRYEPVPSEFDDYIARPKANGYQSLHTAVRVIRPDGRTEVAEAQIRTLAMHEAAETG